MPEETETVTGNPSQGQSTEDKKDSADNQNGQVAEAPVNQEKTSQPSVEACILKTNVSSEVQSEPPPHSEASSSHTNVSSEVESQAWSSSGRPKSPVIMATEAFLVHEQRSPEPETIKPTSKSEPAETLNDQVPQESTEPRKPVQVPEPELVPQLSEKSEPRTPANSEASESGAPSSGDEPHEFVAAPVVEVPPSSEIIVVTQVEAFTTINGDTSEEVPIETKKEQNQEPAPQSLLSNGQSNGECKLEPKKVPEPEPQHPHVERGQMLIETIANELKAEDYKLPDVVEVKKHFEYVEPTHNDMSAAPPKKGALSTRIDSHRVKQAYEDVRYDASETQWAVFKFEGPTIVTSGTGSDFAHFRSHFGDDERAFGYIRVQTGDEMSKRAKFLLVTWVGPSVSVLKRAKMSTDKALIKGILSNFAVELQTENIADINLQNFVTELDKAAGAHYGTGVRG